jgi:hypothetical protein
MPDVTRIKTFVAKDADGNSYTILEYEHWTESLKRGGTRQIPGPREMRTDGGETVNFKSKGHYDVVTRAGRLIPVTSDDPAAA